MSEHKANINWKRATPDFVYETYDRTHQISFEGGQKITGSAAPQFAGKAELANPEEILAAALSSCHMLTFLAVSAKGGFTVDSYEDIPVAILEKNEKGKMAVTKIHLRPKAIFSGPKRPESAQLQELHSKAHANCMVGNSLLSQVIVEPQI
jgi:organic hydroperoxide reductase OsmC/OhrA